MIADQENRVIWWSGDRRDRKTKILFYRKGRKERGGNRKAKAYRWL